MQHTAIRAAIFAACSIAAIIANMPSWSADFVGNTCCGDLEERVAELEATTARKGNRVVSLQVYGQVNKALMIWDDGVDSDAYIVDNDASGSRLGLIGKATLKPGWQAGYLIELDVQDSASDKVYGNYANGAGNTAAIADEGTINATTGVASENEIVIRQNNFYIEGERFGRITLGHGSTAADGAAEVVMANSLRSSDIHFGNDFRIRSTLDTRGVTGSTLRLDQWASNLDASRDDVIRYDSPTIYGFIVSASWGDNDYADVALRFQREFNSVRIAAAIAYQWDDSNDGTTFVDSNSANASFFGGAEVLVGSISLQHIPTGVYGAFSAGRMQTNDQSAGFGPDEARYWYAQLGLERKFLPYGATTVYTDYGVYTDFAALLSNNSDTATGLPALSGSEATRWGLGVVQKFDRAALEVYGQATFWSFTADALRGSDPQFEHFSTIMLGSRVRF